MAEALEGVRRGLTASTVRARRVRRHQSRPAAHEGHQGTAHVQA